MGSREAGASDLCGAWGCATCHTLVDGHRTAKNMTPEQIRLYHHEGMARTIQQLVIDGVLPNP